MSSKYAPKNLKLINKIVLDLDETLIGFERGYSKLLRNLSFLNINYSIIDKTLLIFVCPKGCHIPISINLGPDNLSFFIKDIRLIINKKKCHTATLVVINRLRKVNKMSLETIFIRLIDVEKFKHIF